MSVKHIRSLLKWFKWILVRTVVKQNFAQKKIGYSQVYHLHIEWCLTMWMEFFAENVDFLKVSFLVPFFIFVTVCVLILVFLWFFCCIYIYRKRTLKKSNTSFLQAFICTGENQFRKPSTMMWEYWESKCNQGVKVSFSTREWDKIR